MPSERAAGCDARPGHLQWAYPARGGLPDSGPVTLVPGYAPTFPGLRRADVPQGSSSLAGACTGRHSFEGVTMKTHQALCVKDWHVKSMSGNRLDVRKGKVYTISDLRDDGVTVFGGFWAVAPPDIFTPNLARERALADFVAAFDAWMMARGDELATGRGVTWRELLAARAALDATEEG